MASSSSSDSSFRFVRSCDLHFPVRVKVCTLEGALHRPGHQDLLEDPGLRFCGRNQSRCPDLVVTAALASRGRVLHVPVRTAYRHFTVRLEWNQWLELPLRYSDLPSDSTLCLTLWDAQGPGQRKAVGGTAVRLFDHEGSGGLYLRGQNDLLVWPDREADHSAETSTPGRSKAAADGKKDGLQRLQKLAKDHREGRLPHVDWLDRLAFAEVERISQREKQGSNSLFLMVEFPEIRCDAGSCGLVYYERNGDLRNELSFRSDVVRVPDFDISRDNLVEAKHHRLARSLRAGQSDRDLKPNAETRNKLNDIIAYPSTKGLSLEEEDLVWRYRYYLSSNKKAVSKFVKCINWRSRTESSQALELISRWAPMDPEDALELLGPDYRHPGVRRYAVQRLRQATDQDLQLYLLQLVQALKYERIVDQTSSASSSLSKATLAAPRGDENSTSTASNNSCSSNGNGNEEGIIKSTEGDGEGTTVVPAAPTASNLTGLAAFLIERACQNVCIANYLYWYLIIECEEGDESTAGTGGGGGSGGNGGGGAAGGAATAATAGSPGHAIGGSSEADRRVKDMYNLVLSRLRGALKSGPQDAREIHSFLERQRHFVDRLVRLIKAVHRESGNRQKKIERLQSLLKGGGRSEKGGGGGGGSSESSEFDFLRFSEPLRLPLDPEVMVRGLIPERAALFKSSLMPARLTFRTLDGGEYVTLFKLGDDLRQDQLILQIITLMDQILQQENLDLRLTPYRVLATSSRHGFVQFVDSQPISDILRADHTIQNYFRRHAPSEAGPYGIQPEVMETYVKSCAGYCVITFILGVGDRHLDNLLITTRGNLFHIDFGYILGRDPKVLPPQMKLSREMMEAFGGPSSDHYQQFKKECHTAYLGLRRNASTILSLFSLMVDASVPDIALEPDKTVKKVQEKFKLELEDEAAVAHLESVIDDSAAAVMPAIVDKIHEIAQKLRT